MLAQPPAGSRLIVVDGELGLSPMDVEEALARGTRVIWLAKARRELPGACTSVVELDAGVAGGRVTDVATGLVVEDIVVDGVSLEWCDELARLLAPVRDAGMRTGGTLPRRVSLLELLELEEPSTAAVAERWKRAGEALSAPIGRTAEQAFTIDAAPLEGFRMLLAGMPGAGKSELLQAMIAALAASHPPTRLTFLLVDYKGGAAFRDCVGLPHTVGLITDLDARLADRARVSLLAELRRRESVLQAAGARSLRELTRRRPADAPPALLIVVDEFAALARELPAFVDTLLDVAQRGRSLGLQLVLATQRPRGVVGDALRANMSLRVAMRVSDAAESLDVVDAPDAAAIPASTPGRAVALTGRGADGAPQLTAFQAAYAGGQHLRASRPPECASAGSAGSSPTGSSNGCCPAWAARDRRISRRSSPAPSWLPSGSSCRRHDRPGCRRCRRASTSTTSLRSRCPRWRSGCSTTPRDKRSRRTRSTSSATAGWSCSEREGAAGRRCSVRWPVRSPARALRTRCSCTRSTSAAGRWQDSRRCRTSARRSPATTRSGCCGSSAR